jgi:hypothetical protein
MPMLEVFDQPEGVLSCSRREASTTSTQSLSLLNSQFTVDQSAALARNADVKTIWLKVLQRLPDSNEVSMASEFIARQTKLLGNEEAARKELVRGLLNTNEFLYID